MTALEASITKRFESQLNAANTKATGYEKQLETLLIDNAIATSLAKANVTPVLIDAATALMKSQAKLENGTATIDGNDVGDYIKTWAASDAGKHFVAAPVNSGGGATGSGAQASEWSKMPQTGDEINKWSQFAVQHPDKANALADSWNAPHLKP